jgi:ketosteroid isomerase-like protein
MPPNRTVIWGAVSLSRLARSSRRVSGDLAYEAGTYTVTSASGAAVDAGKYIGVFQKRDGKWLYIRDTWNSDRPPAH